MRRGIVLLEVLLAAAVLAAAVLALATIADRCAARDASAKGLLAASRAAQDLMADAEMRRDLRSGSEQGPVDGLAGGAYTRDVTAAGGSSGTDVYRVVVRVSYVAGGQPRTFDLEKWLVRAHGRQSND
jgi:Tfp pilus assembly protein PilV